MTVLLYVVPGEGAHPDRLAVAHQPERIGIAGLLLDCLADAFGNQFTVFGVEVPDRCLETDRPFLELAAMKPEDPFGPVGEAGIEVIAPEADVLDVSAQLRDVRVGKAECLELAAGFVVWRGVYNEVTGHGPP